MRSVKEAIARGWWYPSDKWIYRSGTITRKFTFIEAEEENIILVCHKVSNGWFPSHMYLSDKFGSIMVEPNTKNVDDVAQFFIDYNPLLWGQSAAMLRKLLPCSFSKYVDKIEFNHHPDDVHAIIARNHELTTVTDKYAAYEEALADDSVQLLWTRP